jgi:maltose/moltooligosaccharide transporter
VRWSFYVGAAAFMGAVLWTVVKSKEYPPEDMAAFLADRNRKRGIFDGLIESFTGIFKMPKTMVQLALVQFFSWFALFAMWIYTTSAVTSHIYGTEDATSAIYNEGADWVGVLFAIYNGVAALFALALPWFARKTSRKFTHMACLFAGGLGLISIYFISDPNYLFLAMIGVGVAWASILSVPYAMLAGALPPNKMGYYMGVFNFFIVIPQIVAAGILGFILRSFFGNEAIFALIVGGVSMILAGLLTLAVRDTDSVRIQEAR